ncbi:hypothetical protein GCM10011519_12180 [Marmoricola endophyticus]|uniref:Uncharacterized protein n=1 Tax=Marmoricola endophyticus TaxID=2040280 RepID=A0A917BGN0_9ACTN|nr:hypothetical protein [Marmoricola endophyticus]GGF40077.1 hypothetical protein GCM10011519_12180 [Marmoricola endophyticus]
MGLLSAPEVRPFPGADRVLAAHEPPQPDLMCGPFAVRTALAALVDTRALPSLADLAHAAGSRTWPEDLPDARPDGAPSVPAPFADDLPVAGSADRSGTDAADLVAAVVTVTNRDVSAVPAQGGTPEGLLGLLARLGDLGPVGVVANLWTGRVGHFVVLWGLTDEEVPRVAVADSYPEVGDEGLPPACRLVGLHELHDALADRGLLVLVRTSDSPVATELVGAAGLSSEIWHG